jgi:phenylacetate-CoA ligase
MISANFFFRTVDKLKFSTAEKLIGRNIQKYVNELDKYFSISWKIRKEIHKNKLIKFIKYSYQNIPYYNKILSENLVKNIEKDIKYIADIPFINKEIIKKNFDNLLNKKIITKKIYSCPSGGSTGEKVVIFYDDIAADKSSSITRFCRNRVRIPGKDLHFASNFKKNFYFKERVKENIKSFILGRDNIFFSSLNEIDLELIIKKIKKYKPRLIHCHPSTMLMILEYCKSKKELFFFKYFESSGELLTDLDKKKIQDYFQCKVIQRYGQAEVGIIAYEFLNDDLIYLMDNSIFCETINNEIIVTNLDNRYMPLIKYQTGDLGELHENEKGFFFQNITGRKHQKINLNNKIYLTHHIQDIFDHQIQNINLFQIKLGKDKKHILFIYTEKINCKEEIVKRINFFFQDSFEIKFINKDQFVYQGENLKFNYIIN